MHNFQNDGVYMDEVTTTLMSAYDKSMLYRLFAEYMKKKYKRHSTKEVEKFMDEIYESMYNGFQSSIDSMKKEQPSQKEEDNLDKVLNSIDDGVDDDINEEIDKQKINVEDKLNKINKYYKEIISNILKEI